MGTSTHENASSPIAASPATWPTSGTAVPRTAEELLMFAPQLRAIREDADSLVRGLTKEQFNWQPDSSRWSIAQCLQHLVTYADDLMAVQRNAIEQARIRDWRSDGPYRHGRLFRMMLGEVEPPVTRKYKTAKAYWPKGDYDAAQLLAEFLLRQDRFSDVIRRAHGLDLGRIRFGVPGIPVVRSSLGQSFTYALAHERRHLWQARQVRSEPGFPGN